MEPGIYFNFVGNVCGVGIECGFFVILDSIYIRCIPSIFEVHSASQNHNVAKSTYNSKWTQYSIFLLESFHVTCGDVKAKDMCFMTAFDFMCCFLEIFDIFNAVFDIFSVLYDNWSVLEEDGSAFYQIFVFKACKSRAIIKADQLLIQFIDSKS